MRIDSFAYLPRSFRPLYELAPSGDEPVWAPFEPRLAEATIALLSSAGLYVKGEQPPFDLDRERAEPTWGDPTHRVIPDGTAPSALGMCHLHVNNTDVLADPEIALPVQRLSELVADGIVGSSAPTHISVMGYQQAGLEGWREHTAPAIVERLRDERVDGVVLAPV
ncbi:MAG TPA: glycine/sarcosine/betaine reductase selenoprotein B family protein [Acidimicrobiales bacterium]|nr:glycine/sarcosine/betaine reductase selenoprotein B family protein [Acidimicrobiales bacterium]